MTMYFVGLIFVAFITCCCCINHAIIFASADPSPLQDFCVADFSTSTVNVNGATCKDAKDVQADDFFFTGLNIAGDTSSTPFGSKGNPVFATQLPGLNTLGVAMSRLDFAPWGINPLHIHPRATEVLTVMEGSLLVGFITSNPKNRLITKLLQKGDVFVFPKGLIHFQKNVGDGHAFSIAVFGSQNPGAITIGNATFASNPKIDSDILAKAFHVDKNTMEHIQSQF